MDGLIDILWAKASEHLYCSKEQYVETLKGWAIEAVEQDGVPVGAVLRKEDEFHFITFGAAPRISRATVRAVLAPQLEAFGHVLTRTPRLEERQHRFNKTVGFVQTGEDEYNIHYRLDRGRCAVTRSTQCPPSQS